MRSRLPGDRLRRFFAKNLAKPLGYALLATALALLVGFGNALGFRREFWLHPQSFGDAMSGLPVMALAVFCATFVVLWALRSRL